jgi:catechol 2,3-dioxygenase-like lactoylglutathione lyase family enzyme
MEETQLKPGILTHGTLEVRDIQQSMRFYREFLLMDVIQHLPIACRISLGGNWYIVCLEAKQSRDMPLLNHFGIDVDSREAVDRWHERAVAQKEAYGLSEISSPRSSHGAYQFYLRDRDQNWWEFQHYEGDARTAHLDWGARQTEKLLKRTGPRQE